MAVHFADQLVAFANGSDDFDAVNGGTGHFTRVLDQRNRVAGRRRSQQTRIAHLAARFGVERRAVEHQLGVAIVFDHAQNFDRRFQSFATDEFGGRKIFVHRRDLRFIGAAPTRARPRPLLFHLGVEAFLVDGETALPCHLFLLVQRKAEGVVELERSGAGQHATGRGLGFIDEHFLRYLERGGVAMLFILDDAGDALDAFEHLGVTGLHQIGDEAGEFV